MAGGAGCEVLGESGTLEENWRVMRKKENGTAVAVDEDHVMVTAVTRINSDIRRFEDSHGWGDQRSESDVRDKGRKGRSSRAGLEERVTY